MEIRRSGGGAGREHLEVIIEVGIGDEARHSYRLCRDGQRMTVRRIVAVGDGMERAKNNQASGPAAATEPAAVSPGRAGHDDANENDCGHETTIDWRQPRPGLYSLLIDGASYEVFIEENPDHLSVHLVRRTLRVHAADLRRRRAHAGISATTDGVIKIIAPIPGRVARIMVETGQRVRRGDGVVVLEAMKMENELRAPRDGVVAGVDVKEGQGVEGGALLASIE